MPECASGPEVQTPDSQFAGQQVNRNGGGGGGGGSGGQACRAGPGLNSTTRKVLRNTAEGWWGEKPGGRTACLVC